MICCPTFYDIFDHLDIDFHPLADIPSYDFAGQIRSKNLAKGGFQFAAARYLWEGGVFIFRIPKAVSPPAGSGPAPSQDLPAAAYRLRR